MKLSIASILLSVSLVNGFSLTPSNRVQSTALQASRREILNGAVAAATTIGGVVLAPTPAFAGEYVPKVDDCKQIYFLGASLDKLVIKLGNPDTTDAALEAVRLFNKDINFYPGYAKNFLLKSLKKGADQDARYGYIKQVRFRVLLLDYGVDLSADD